MNPHGSAVVRTERRAPRHPDGPALQRPQHGNTPARPARDVPRCAGDRYSRARTPCAPRQAPALPPGVSADAFLALNVATSPLGSGWMRMRGRRDRLVGEPALDVRVPGRSPGRLGGVSPSDFHVRHTLSSEQNDPGASGHPSTRRRAPQHRSQSRLITGTQHNRRSNRHTRLFQKLTVKSLTTRDTRWAEPTDNPRRMGSLFRSPMGQRAGGIQRLRGEHLLDRLPRDADFSGEVGL